MFVLIAPSERNRLLVANYLLFCIAFEGDTEGWSYKSGSSAGCSAAAAPLKHFTSHRSATRLQPRHPDRPACPPVHHPLITDSNQLYSSLSLSTKHYIMKLSTVSLFALSTAAVNARFVEEHETNQVILNGGVVEEQFLIELTPGKTRWVSEEEKWELRRVSKARR